MPGTRNNLLFLNPKPDSNSTENCLCRSDEFVCGKIIGFRRHSNLNVVTPVLLWFPDIVEVVVVCCLIKESYFTLSAGDNPISAAARHLYIVNYCCTKSRVYTEASSEPSSTTGWWSCAVISLS